MSTIEPEALTWTGLLAQWVRFAQASLALPDEADGSRWRASVTPVINLQAVTFALADLDRVAVPEQPLALDKAEIIIRESRAQLQRIWADFETPNSLCEIQRDAELAFETRRALLKRSFDGQAGDDSGMI